MAISSTVKARPSLGGLFTVKLEGPGWVFIQNDSNSVIRENKLTTLLIVLIVFYLLLGVFKNQIQ